MSSQNAFDAIDPGRRELRFYGVVGLAAEPTGFDLTARMNQ
jgi:hypothetical protein